MPYVEPRQTHAWCKLGEHRELVSEFLGRWRDKPDGPIWEIDSSCKFHQETQRHTEKHADLAWHILKCRADSLARRTRTTREFILRDTRGPTWIRLLPLIRAFLVEHGEECSDDTVVCLSCGRPFGGVTSNVQLDHIHAPRDLPDGQVDWARHCARNIRILCGSCNNGKRRQQDDAWVDEQYRWQLLDADREDGVREALEKPCGCPPDGICLLCWNEDAGGGVQFAA